MNDDSRALRRIIVAVVWCLILISVAGIYRYVIAPYFSERLEKQTGSDSQYDHTLTLALDSFSGYAVLRSQVFANQLKSARIRLEVTDDKADYPARLKALQSGEVQIAAFTVDSLISAGAALGEFPCSIILVLDETAGADAVIAYEQGVKNIQDLDSPDARFVFTPASPSEFLARVVLSDFSLPGLPEQWWEHRDGAAEVYRAFTAADKSAKRAYVLWEPYASKALKEPGAHVLLDSSNVAGYIVDVLVAGRRFLQEQPEVATEVVETYLRTLYSYRARDGGMTDLVMADSKGADNLDKAQAEKLVGSILWKTTQDNFEHFGLVPSLVASNTQMEDMIAGITRVLVRTKAVAGDPLAGKANLLYYDNILRTLRDRGFHPAKKDGALTALPSGAEQLDEATKRAALPALSDSQWEALRPVGEMRVDPIAFGRGTARINVQSERDLRELGSRLVALPQYYLKVVGSARAEGDPEANRTLARERAQAAADALRAAGVASERLHVEVSASQVSDASAQSVSFVVGQTPY